METARVRPIRDDEYPRVAEIGNAAYPPDAPRFNVEMLRHFDKVLSGKYNLSRYVGECAGVVAASGYYCNMPHLYDPQRFRIQFMVHPEYQRRGLGTALYDFLLAELHQRRVRQIFCLCREDMHAGCQFVEARGYSLEHREIESHVPLDQFDPTAWDDLMAKVEGSGVRIITLPEWRKHPDWKRKLYEIVIHVQQDMPVSETYTPFSFEDFDLWFMKGPRLLPEGYHLAIAGDQVVGISILDKDLSDSRKLLTDDTGVHRDYRRRGIATALKVKALTWAKSAGYREVRTLNDATNDTMLTINGRLGFQRFPVWIGYALNLNPDS